MESFDQHHLLLLKSLPEFDEGRLGTYFEISPDGEYREDQYIDVYPEEGHYMGA